MNDHWSVMVACNWHGNGMFQGHASAVDILSPDGDIAANFHTEDKGGRPLKFAEQERAIRFGAKFVVPILGGRHWVGNWCWNRYWLADEQAARLLRTLWRSFSCEGGWCDLIDPLEAGRPASVALLRRLAEK